MYNQVLSNQVPNLNHYHYPVNKQDERFGFLPFVGGLAVGALAGGFGGRPCGPACGPMYGPPPMSMPVQMMPMPMPAPQFIPIPVQTLPANLPPQQFQQFQSIQPGGVVQGPILESNKFYIR